MKVLYTCSSLLGNLRKGSFPALLATSHLEGEIVVFCLARRDGALEEECAGYLWSLCWRGRDETLNVALSAAGEVTCKCPGHPPSSRPAVLGAPPDHS